MLEVSRQRESMNDGHTQLVKIMMVVVKSTRDLGVSTIKFKQEPTILAIVQHSNVMHLIDYGFLKKSQSS